MTRSTKTRSTRPSATGVGAPDFIGIGAQKSATTYIYEVLRRHPSLVFPATRDRFNPPAINLDGRLVVTWPKEIQFLSGANSHIAWDDYLRLFSEKAEGKIYGEISPSYLSAPTTRIRELYDRAPNVRLFAILRDPVERDWSAIRMIANRRGELDDLVALREIADWGQILEMGDYAAGLKTWLAVFPREQLLVLPYELLARDVAPFLASLCEHLGAPPEPLADVPQDPIFHGGDAARIVFRGPDAPLPDGTRAHLSKRYAHTAATLAELTGIDFTTYWSSHDG